MVILTTMIGFAVLVIGRHLFWVFVSGLGFVLGLIYGGQYLNTQPQWMILLLSAIIALLGALLAYTLQRAAAGLIGYATGWYLAVIITRYLSLDLGDFERAVPIIIGVISGLLIMRYFDWGAIILSSLAGAAIIVSGMTYNNRVEMIMLGSLTLLGVMIQGMFYFQEDEWVR
jgi:hypothetical protein